MVSVEERFAEIERRLALLEAGSPSLPKETVQLESRNSSENLISLTISNKIYEPTNAALGVYEDHIWFDCTYTLKPESKPTRAVKGEMLFSDLFGEVKFKLLYTINEPLTPGKPFPKRGIGFTYNQFIAEHQWMLATEIKDMNCSFKISNTIYTDGTTDQSL